MYDGVIISSAADITDWAFKEILKYLRPGVTESYLASNLENLIKSKVNIFKDKANIKSPGAVGFEPHQDATIWKNMYGIKNFLTIVVSIDKSDIKNGCLEIAESNNIKRLLGKEWKKIPKKIEKKLKWRKIENTNTNTNIRPKGVIFGITNTAKLRSNQYEN